MKFKVVVLLLFVSLLLMGSVCAQRTVNDFQVDGSYEHAHNGVSESIYLNKAHDTGITIYRYAADDDDDDDAFDNLVHDEGNEYLTPDDDMQINRNADNTVNFTDYDHAEHGVAEVVNADGQQFIIVFWTKNTSNVDNANLISQLNQFNKDNNVSPVSF